MSPTPIVTKNPNEIRDDILRGIKNGLISRGIANPNVGPNSDYYRFASALSNQISLGLANTIAKADSVLPDSASGSDLDRLCEIFGLSRRAAGSSTGYVILATSATTLVTAGQELIDSVYGSKYFVQLGGSYANGALIPIQSTNTGTATNLSGGTSFKWSSPPAYASQDALASSAGVLGGVDAEDDETLRARLLVRLSSPPGSGNASQIAQVAEEASSEVQKAFPYPAANGPGTVHIAVAGYQSSNTDQTRAVSATALNLVKSAVVNALPEYVEATITDCTAYPADVSFSITIPDSTSALPFPGPGGGWVDADPYPLPSTGSQYVSIYDFTDENNFSIVSQSKPVVGQTISWIRPTDHKLFTAKIVSIYFYTTSEPWDCTITLDTRLQGTDFNHWIFPGITNASTYLAAVLDSFAKLGPGEKLPITAVGLLPRALRRPLASQSWSNALDAKFLKNLEDSGSEVYSASWLYQNAYPIVSSLSPPTTIAAHGDINLQPCIFTPNKIAFYK
jgi:uncharacterized phage protein gp47/JayE